MNRIERTFMELARTGRKGLVGYLTAGDPDLKRSEANIRAGLRNGLDVLELGVPFSDPTADGPEIQEASRRALAGGMNLRRAIALVARLRRDCETPIILFGYANPFFRYGYEKLCADAQKAGVDGLLVVDLPFEESWELRSAMDKRGLFFIPLIAPTTPQPRAASILKDARGFIYYIMVTGVTGARTKLAANLSRQLKNLRKSSKLPIAVGFGVSNGGQAREAARFADAVVVGSALVRAAKEGRLPGFVRELRNALG